jgi:hypothetical protein
MSMRNSLTKCFFFGLVLFCSAAYFERHSIPCRDVCNTLCLRMSSPYCDLVLATNNSRIFPYIRAGIGMNRTMVSRVSFLSTVPWSLPFFAGSPGTSPAFTKETYP